MKITFNTAEEASKFYKVMKRKRNRKLKTIGWIFWGLFCFAGMIYLTGLLEKAEGLNYYVGVFFIFMVMVFLLVAITMVSMFLNTSILDLECWLENKMEEGNLEKGGKNEINKTFYNFGTNKGYN